MPSTKLPRWSINIGWCWLLTYNPNIKLCLSFRRYECIWICIHKYIYIQNSCIFSSISPKLQNVQIDWIWIVKPLWKIGGLEIFSFPQKTRMSHEKNPALLSMKSWLFYTDPYHGLWNNPYTSWFMKGSLSCFYHGLWKMLLGSLPLNILLFCRIFVLCPFLQAQTPRIFSWRRFFIVGVWGKNRTPPWN